MGKQQKRGNKKGKKQNKASKTPFVSICTPTFNRRPFIPTAIQCYMHQDYPREKMEWIIIDDGSDKIEDLVKDVPGVKYFEYDEKMSLGKKRNLMHEKSKGDIIVYLDDDDYYPPDRVSHAVSMLQSNKKALCAGSSEIYIYFKHIQSMYQFGPYGPNHSTAGTFAFKRELLKQTSYEDHAALAEEKHFLKNYTIPFVQLEPKKTILVFSHDHNTFDKKKLLENKHPKFVKESNKTVDDFIKEPALKKFFIEDIDEALATYEPGLPKHKPDVLEQTKEIEQRRAAKEKELREEAMRKQQTAAKMPLQHNQITVTHPDGRKQALSTEKALEMLQNMQKKIHNQQQMINGLQMQVTEKDKELMEAKKEIRLLQKEHGVEGSDEVTPEDIEAQLSETIILDIKEGTNDTSVFDPVLKHQEKENKSNEDEN